MRPQQPDNSSWPATGLAACVLGVLLCPFAYIAIGALGSFAAQLSWVSLPHLLASCGYLLARYLRKPGSANSSSLQLMAEGMCWLAIAAFLTIISGFTLLTTFERIGAACMLFLVTAAFCLPLVALRQTALRQRLSRLRPSLARAVLVLIVLAAGVMTTVHLMVPARFI